MWEGLHRTTNHEVQPRHLIVQCNHRDFLSRNICSSHPVIPYWTSLSEIRQYCNGWHKTALLQRRGVRLRDQNRHSKSFYYPFMTYLITVPQMFPSAGYSKTSTSYALCSYRDTLAETASRQAAIIPLQTKDISPQTSYRIRCWLSPLCKEDGTQAFADTQDLWPITMSRRFTIWPHRFLTLGRGLHSSGWTG